MSGAYTESDWDAENDALLGGAEPAECPGCRRTGFYGPRRASPERKYGACTFCGFVQDVGEPAVRYRATVHRCEGWPRVAGAPYIHWVPPEEVSCPCPCCGQPVRAAEAEIPPPADDPDHPWWKVPQKMTQVDSLLFWRSSIDSRLPLQSRLYL